MIISALETVLTGLGVDGVVREAIVGDLIEEHSRLATARGEIHADRWVRRQVVRSIPFFARGTLRAGGPRLIAATLLAALCALLAVDLLSGASVAVASLMLGPDVLERAAIAALALDLVYAAFGGYLAARFGRAAPLGAALVVGLSGVLLTAISGAPMHTLNRIALQLLIVPATIGGGWLRVRGLIARSRA